MALVAASCDAVLSDDGVELVDGATASRIILKFSATMALSWE
jgi:hypothetical protein